MIGSCSQSRGREGLHEGREASGRAAAVRVAGVVLHEAAVAARATAAAAAACKGRAVGGDHVSGQEGLAEAPPPHEVKGPPRRHVLQLVPDPVYAEGAAPRLVKPPLPAHGLGPGLGPGPALAGEGFLVLLLEPPSCVRVVALPVALRWGTRYS